MSTRSRDMFAPDGAFEAVEAENEPLSVQNTVRRYHDSPIHFPCQRVRVPEDALDVAQELLYKTIEQLPPKCRQVFLLSRVRRMTYGEIAQHCGISRKMVEKHVSHALAVCMQKVSQNI